jgi:polyhydroxybutyrate depolymerase
LTKSKLRIGLAGAVAFVLLGGSLAALLVGASSDTRPRAAAATTTTSAGPVQWVAATHQLTYGGLARSYRVLRPSFSGGRLPLLVVLHGRDATPQLEAQRTGFRTVTGAAVLVYPAGYGQSWNAGACCAQAHAAGVDDVGFVAAVVRQVRSTEPDLAPGSVYLAGYSNGGKLAYRLACADPRLFTAVAAVGAVSVAACPDPAPVAFMEVANSGDPELSWGAAPPLQIEGYTERSVDTEVTQRARANGCVGPSPSSVRGSLTLTDWSGCPPGRPVALAKYQSTTHAWPAGDPSTPSAERVIWDFFRSVGRTA